MKPELKAKRERLKKQVEEARKKIENSENMTKAEKDAALINAMMRKEVDEEVVETEEEKKNKEEILKHKHFKCKCGMQVDLYGEAEQKKCSKCLENE